jgi:hypothetical protein
VVGVSDGASGLGALHRERHLGVRAHLAEGDCPESSPHVVLKRRGVNDVETDLELSASTAKKLFELRGAVSDALRRIATRSSALLIGQVDVGQPPLVAFDTPCPDG